MNFDDTRFFKVQQRNLFQLIDISPTSGDIHCNSITVGFVEHRVLIHFTTGINLILHTAQDHLYLYAASSLFMDKLVCETYQGSVVS